MSLRRRSDRGSTLVEFALVVPLLVAAMFGILQYGYQYWALETASASAREAARRLAVGTEEACTRTEAVDRLSAPAVGSAAPAVSVAYVTTRAPGNLLRVTVSFDSLHIPFIPLPDDGRITETAEARIESVPATALPC